MNDDDVKKISLEITTMIMAEDWAGIISFINSKNPGALLYINAYLPHLMKLYSIVDIEIILRIMYSVTMFTSMETTLMHTENLKSIHLN